MVIAGESEQNQKEKSNKKRKFEMGEEGSSYKGQNQRANQRFKPQSGPGNFKKKEFGNKSQETRSQSTSGRKPPQGSIPESQARTFNMNVKDAIQSSDVVSGTLSVNPASAKVLIDSGATRSFISKSFIAKLDCETQLMHEPLSFILANQDRVFVNRICPHCTIEIAEHVFPANLIPFQLGEFDVILGMYWLTSFSAQIDCKDKIVVLSTPQGKKVTFKGQKQTQTFLTSIQTKKLIHKGCEAYLAYVVDKGREVSNPEDIPVVRDFLDVFPKELPGLPPGRQVEFIIDLVPSTEPISKAPYRMAPTEMKELEK
ncbi:uncharacterized protein LOC141665897 [Apium graveolens]|uniref:uncharacterized protein LOC141665897 n=1 Tax=Apium graveolens TaxID=4045 RepID=UPI003D7BE089